jgi:hypothetical protein
MSTIRLTPHSEELLQKQLTRGPYRPSEEVIERALETLAQKESAGGAYIVFYVCAPRTRATSLSPRPIHGLFWLLNGRRHEGQCRRHPRISRGACGKDRKKACDPPTVQCLMGGRPAEPPRQPSRKRQRRQPD